MSEPDSTLVLTLRCPRKLRKKTLSEFARRLRDEVSGGRIFTILLTDDRELLRLNRDFLGKDYPTDVLSFPDGEGETLGEMAISVQRAEEQAADFGHSTEEEVRILMLHGVLHLMGMDHETDRGRMARVEQQWRRKLGLTASLIERAGK